MLVFKMCKKICKKFFYCCVWCISSLFPLENKIVVVSYYGRDYGDNAKYIVEELLKSYDENNIIWIVKENDKAGFPNSVKICNWNSVASIYHMATAKVWLDNCRRSFLFKRKNQFYIQTWHGMALKRIEKDVENHLEKEYVKKAIKDSKAIDVIISEAKFMTKIYKSSFWYDGTVLEWGSPRNDIILDSHLSKKAKDKICKYYNISSSYKIVLYAPTFRANKSTEPYDIDFGRLKSVCEKKFDGQFLVMLRLHPNIAKMSNNLNFDETYVKDATYYSDMQELLAASDVVISDYSSLMFDFALSNKPCFQFAMDIDEYKKDRNFYINLSELPFGLATDNDELEIIISAHNQKEYETRLKIFFDKYGMIRNGDSSKKCAMLIREQCLTNKFI